MTKQYLINEDNLPPKIPVIFSYEIMREIENFKGNNQFEKEGLLKLFYYIKGIEKHISNRAIAFGYGNEYTRYPNGTTIINDMGVSFSLVDYSERTFVQIVWIDFNLEDFGLMESKKKKNVILTESQLRNIIREALTKVLR